MSLTMKFNKNQRRFKVILLYGNFEFGETGKSVEIYQLDGVLDVPEKDAEAIGEKLLEAGHDSYFIPELSDKKIKAIKHQSKRNLDQIKFKTEKTVTELIKTLENMKEYIWGLEQITSHNADELISIANEGIKKAKKSIEKHSSSTMKNKNVEHAPKQWEAKVTDFNGIELINEKDGLAYATISGATPEAETLIIAAPKLREACQTALKDCYMALSGEWDKSDFGFNAMIDILEQAINRSHAKRSLSHDE